MTENNKVVENINDKSEFFLLKKDFEEVQKREKENWDLYIRARAEIENVHKFYERTITREQKKLLLDFIKDFFVVIDGIDIGIKEAIDPSKNVQESYITGLIAIRDLFFTILSKYEIIILNPIGEIFEPKYHEVIKIVSIDSLENNNKILEVVQKGYIYSDSLLRSAKVVIGVYNTTLT